MTATFKPSNATFVEDARRIAVEVAGPCADAVDREARFPSEAVEAMRSSGLLSAQVPVGLGGADAGLPELAECAFELGRRCAATAMVFAMHQMQVACLARHRSPAAERALQQVAGENLLIASVTSEVGTGGGLGRSVAAVEEAGDGRIRFLKRAPTVSYGEHADAYMTTLRRAPGAEADDQVLVFTRREETMLEPAGAWDTLGMRGTCSPGFVVRADAPAQAVLETPFARILVESMGPFSWILWSHAWLGIATDAFDRARRFTRDSARRSPETAAPVATRVAQLMARYAPLRATVRGALPEFLELDASDGREGLYAMASALWLNVLKVAASQGTVEVCQGALDLVGIAGYRNDSRYSVGRHLRDALSAPLMVANERLNSLNGTMLTVVKEIEPDR